jgi:hypothetical protein
VSAEMSGERSAYVEAVLQSSSVRKVIVAGPCTGKTFTFKRLLEATPDPKLVLTFIRCLARNIEAEVGGLAQVNTFHGFCKHVLYKSAVAPLTEKVIYYPPASRDRRHRSSRG